jgi:2-haloacid dehalogenase
MSDTPMLHIRACVFDAYGTLFDYASAAARCGDALGENFWQVTGDALDFAMETLASPMARCARG